ncbi:MAG: hypothetical protein RIR12_214 [Bacteroidota bacterium]|jgi:hypothetical protein
MKNIYFIVATFWASAACFSQSQTFDITTYTPPKGWQKQSTESTIQFSKEDAAKGGYCIIMLFKSVPGTTNAKDNFDAAWETVVKESVTTSTAPEMQTPATKNGWEAQTGYAPFESDGQKGIALLVTSSGFGKMVNILVLTNTDIYEKHMSEFLESISFKKIVQTNPTPAKQPAKQTNTMPVSSTAKKDGYAFTTTNFDDGWNSTVKEDWVEVSKGNIKVLLHYPKEGTIFPADPDKLTTAAWNILVAPRYNNLTNFKTAYVETNNRPYFGMGNIKENNSGNSVFVVLFRRGAGWMEIVAPDVLTFTREFGFNPQTIRWAKVSDYSGGYIVDNSKGVVILADEDEVYNKLANMASRNKFAVAASDIDNTGRWNANFASNTFYYNYYNGNYAGMSTFSASEWYAFSSGNKYHWEAVMTNTGGGVMNAAQSKSDGTFKSLNNWQLYFSNIGGQAKTFDVYFSAIKGGRILWVNDVKHPGSGIFTGLSRKK